MRIQQDQTNLARALEEQTATSSVQNFETKELIKSQHERTRKTILASIKGRKLRRTQHDIDTISDVSDSDDELDHPEKLRLIEDMLLETLRFQTMMDRFDEVEPAHQKTYEWIFKSPDADPQDATWTDFPNWLAHDTGTYWINGKAASGKSTIMRFI
jgi:hypothetical protein